METEKIRGNTLEHWKQNAEEDYAKTPISVLKYITVLEEKNQALCGGSVKRIEVSDEMHEFLMNLSKELNTQDHRSTAMPYFFQIQTQEKVPAAEGCGTEAWIYDGSMIETDEELAEAIAEYKGISVEDATKLSWHDRDTALEEAGYRKVNYEMKEVYQNAFLTSKACDDHIRANRHHYKSPVNYLVHAFRNPEMEMVLKFLCELTGGEIHK